MIAKLKTNVINYFHKFENLHWSSQKYYILIRNLHDALRKSQQLKAIQLSTWTFNFVSSQRETWIARFWLLFPVTGTAERLEAAVVPEPKKEGSRGK